MYSHPAIIPFRISLYAETFGLLKYTYNKCMPKFYFQFLNPMNLLRMNDWKSVVGGTIILDWEFNNIKEIYIYSSNSLYYIT